ncbi:hypothetical protein Poli38472_007577 [Pythium oligandrum]|uniref:M96 mating-specific protein family n=1 Tax=Pythium oligandrum TaxID=41045 RepID=A0A8K1FL67_PYTOL|nr:hypothetical protein Poli38472_007577 [Pythium oligandrum]|eukprot:TMW67905.1 hypothetical protein Poli38472_007577 [Pythium oligandrum]
METVTHMKMSTEADADTLAAVLAYIDEYADQEEFKGAFSSDDTTASSSRGSYEDGHPSNEPPTRRVTEKSTAHNRARYRQRLELVALREEEATLRKQLEELRLVKQMEATAEHVEMTIRSRALRQGMLTAWKDVSSRQLKRRQAAEEENARLKKRAREQRHVVKMLKNFIEQQIRRVNHPLASSSLYSPAQEDSRRMMSMFAELLTDLKGIHATTNLWLQKSDSYCLADGRYVESRIVPLSPTQVVVEIVDVRLLPFPFDAMGDGYWSRAISKPCKVVHSFFHEETQVEGRDTVFSGKAYHNDRGIAGSGNVRLRSHTSTQKFQDPDQIIIANASRSDSLQVDSQDVHGVHLREQYWNIFRPPEPTANEACLLLSFGNVLLTVDPGKHGAPQAVPILTQYFQSRMHDVVDHNVSAAEEWLLQSSL